MLTSINEIVLKTEVETLFEQRTHGHWTIVTKFTKGANKLIPQNMSTTGPEHEKHKLEPHY